MQDGIRAFLYLTSDQQLYCLPQLLSANNLAQVYTFLRLSWAPAIVDGLEVVPESAKPTVKDVLAAAAQPGCQYTASGSPNTPTPNVGGNPPNYNNTGSPISPSIGPARGPSPSIGPDQGYVALWFNGHHQQSQSIGASIVMILQCALYCQHAHLL